MYRRFLKWLDAWRRKRDERKSLKLYGCACFCPDCGEVLQIHALHCTVIGPARYQYACICGVRSTFDFAIAPVPIFLSREGT